MKTAFDGMQIARRPSGLLVAKETPADLTPSTVNIYGRYSIFDPCQTGDIFGLQVETHGLMNWLGWRPNKYYRRRVTFITWMGPEGTSTGEATTGAGSPCANPAGWEYGSCGYNMVHTSWYHRGGDALDPHTVVQDRCETSPRYRLNGKMISDDVEWQMNGLMTALNMGIQRDLIHGSHQNSYEMDGLESIIKEGYEDDDGRPCHDLDSILLDWEHDGLDGAVNGFGNFFNYLDEIVNDIEYRAKDLGLIMPQDMILLTTRFMATALLDAYSCYTICGVTEAGDVSDQALRGQIRQNRLDLNGGPLYDGASAVGYIQLKSGRKLPIMVDDSLDISKSGTTYCNDVYLLTRRIGSLDVLYGEYLDMREFENRVKKFYNNFTARADAAGRFIIKGKEDNWCFTMMMGTSPELYIAAPWAQVRISNVCVTRHRVPVNGDPFQPQYLPSQGVLYKAAAYS